MTVVNQPELVRSGLAGLSEEDPFATIEPRGPDVGSARGWQEMELPRGASTGRRGLLADHDPRLSSSAFTPSPRRDLKLLEHQVLDDLAATYEKGPQEASHGPERGAQGAATPADDGRGDRR